MKRANQNIPNWILSGKEEKKLSLEEKEIYYKKLREFCLNRKLCTTTPGALTIAPKCKKFVEKVVRKLVPLLAGGTVEVVSDGHDNIPEEAVIFANIHQGILDNFCWITENPKHSLILHASDVNKLLIFSQLWTGLVLVSKKEEDKENRINAKLDMMHILLRGTSMWYFPEGTWNLSPNKLHLPMSYGFLEIAQKTKKPVVPVVTEFTYDTSADKERIRKIHIRYGKPIYVPIDSSLDVKLREYEESISTIRWSLLEQQGVTKRESVTNWDYINYLKGNYRNLKLGNKDWELEKKRMRGSADDFYKFHHINDVPWDAWGELCETEEVRRLKQINKLHGI